MHIIWASSVPIKQLNITKVDIFVQSCIPMNFFMKMYAGMINILLQDIGS